MTYSIRNCPSLPVREEGERVGGLKNVNKCEQTGEKKAKEREELF